MEEEEQGRKTNTKGFLIHVPGREPELTGDWFSAHVNNEPEHVTRVDLTELYRELLKLRRLRDRVLSALQGEIAEIANEGPRAEHFLRLSSD